MTFYQKWHQWIQNKNNVACNNWLGIRGIQTEPLVKNNSNVDEGVTLETQLDSQRKNGPINGNP